MTPGLVGRLVSVKVMRGDTEAREVCEVVACQTGGEYGTWRILVATHDGTLLEYGTRDMTLVGEPQQGGPYR